MCIFTNHFLGGQSYLVAVFDTINTNIVKNVEIIDPRAQLNELIAFGECQEAFIHRVLLIVCNHSFVYSKFCPFHDCHRCFEFPKLVHQRQRFNSCNRGRSWSIRCLDTYADYVAIESRSWNRGSTPIYTIIGYAWGWWSCMLWQNFRYWR